MVADGKEGGNPGIVDEDGWEVVPDHLLGTNPSPTYHGNGAASDDYFEAQWESEMVVKPGDSPGSSPTHSSGNSVGSPTAKASKSKKRASPGLHAIPSRLPTLAPVSARTRPIIVQRRRRRRCGSRRFTTSSPNRTPSVRGQSSRRVGSGGH